VGFRPLPRPAAWLWILAAAVNPVAAEPESGAPAPLVLLFDQPHARFDDTYQHSTVVHRYQVVNPGNRPIRILEVVPRSPEGWVEGVPVTLPPAGGSELVFHLPTAERLGTVAVRVGVYTDEREALDRSPGTAHYKLSLSGFVQSAFDPESLVLNFGKVDRTLGAVKTLEAGSREVRSLEIRGFPELPSMLSARDVGTTDPLGGSRTLEFRLATGLPLGLHGGRVLIETNVPHQPIVALRYLAHVVGEIVPDQGPLVFDGVRSGEVIKATLEFRSRSDKLFKFKSIEDSEKRFSSASDVPCAAEAEDITAPTTCRRLTFRTVLAAEGSFSGVLSIHFMGIEETVPIAYRGWALGRDAILRRIEVETPDEQ